MEREIANVMKASGLRNFRYVAFPPLVFEVPARIAEEDIPLQPEPTAGEPELVVAPENEPPAPPEPMPALPPLSPHVESQAPEAPAAAVGPAAWTPPAPEPVPDPPIRSRPVPPPAASGGLRMLNEAAAAAASPHVAPKPPATPRRFALLDDIQTETRPRRARTGRRAPADQP